jgi:hypothetical protein
VQGCAFAHQQLSQAKYQANQRSDTVDGDWMRGV